MKKKVLLFCCLMLVFLSFNGCGINEETLNDDNSSEEKVDKLDINESEKWQSIYKSFLSDLYKNNDSDETIQFLIKDLDNNGIPELIIKKVVKLTIYTFEKNLIEIGNQDFLTGTTRFLGSDHSSYPGILYFYVSGGLNHYGYISIKDNKLNDEELWNEDYSGISKELGKNRDRIEELSSDKKLIEESKKAYEKNRDLSFMELLPSNFNNLEEADV